MYKEYLSLARQIKSLKLGDYLEFGCGDGTFLKYVLDQNSSFKTVTAVDINPESVNKARETLTAIDIQFIIQEKLPLDIDNNQFSTITLSNTLHHLRDKTAVLVELKRLIKPNGQIIITEMISNDLSGAEQTYCRFHALRAEIDRLKGTFHDTTYTSDEIEQLVVAAGLRMNKRKILINDKTVVMDEDEISNMETIIDDLIQGEIERIEFEDLASKAEGIKENLRQFGIKRPRQIYLETTGQHEVV